MVVGKKIHQAI